MKNNQTPSVGPAGVSPTYVYLVGETDTFYYTKTAEVVDAAMRHQPKLAEDYPKLSREKLGTMLAKLLDHDRLEKLLATHPTEMVQARMLLLLDAYIKYSPAFGAAVRAGFDSVIYTAFRTVDGNHMIRICGAVTQRRPMTTAEAIDRAGELVHNPWIRNLYAGDGLAPSSTYHLLAKKTA